jgi:hypothetical protein
VRTAAVRRRTAAVQAGNDYFFPFLPFLFFFLPVLLFLATPITPLPDRKVNEMLTEKRQRIIDADPVSNTL